MESGNFYTSDAWRRLRYEVIQKYGRVCLACGRSKEKHNIVIHVDHIKPRSIYPHLELEISNLQTLCEDCNLGKSNRSNDNWSVIHKRIYKTETLPTSKRKKRDEFKAKEKLEKKLKRLEKKERLKKLLMLPKNNNQCDHRPFLQNKIDKMAIDGNQNRNSMICRKCNELVIVNEKTAFELVKYNSK